MESPDSASVIGRTIQRMVVWHRRSARSVRQARRLLHSRPVRRLRFLRARRSDKRVAAGGGQHRRFRRVRCGSSSARIQCRDRGCADRPPHSGPRRHGRYIRGVPLVDLDPNGNGAIGWLEMNARVARARPSRCRQSAADPVLRLAARCKGRPLPLDQFPRVAGFRNRCTTIFAHPEADPTGALRAAGPGGPQPVSGQCPSACCSIRVPPDSTRWIRVAPPPSNRTRSALSHALLRSDLRHQSRLHRGQSALL